MGTVISITGAQAAARERQARDGMKNAHLTLPIPSWPETTRDRLNR